MKKTLTHQHLISLKKLTGVFGLLMILAASYCQAATISVAGATGRTGVHIVKYLQDSKDHQVRALARDETKAKKLLGENVPRRSGIAYTIIRPSGLKDEVGNQLGIRFGQGDNLGRGTINRADVAMTAVKALFNPAAYRKTFEILNSDKKERVDRQTAFAVLTADVPIEPTANP